MFGHQYYNGVLRKYVIMFGNMFNDIVVQRLNNAGQRVQAIKVPIAYGPKEKFLVRLAQDPNLDQDVAISLPRIGFEMNGMNYNPQRKLNTMQKNILIQTADGDKVKQQYVPVPYDLNFQLGIFVKNADDGTQILEQILPFFTPEWTNTVRLIPEMSLNYDIATVLNGISLEDTYEGDFDTRRALIWTLDFLVKAWIFGPTTKSGIIKRSDINFLIPRTDWESGVSNTTITQAQTNKATVSEKIKLTPGLIVNSTGRFATTNSAASVATSQITANDDYGFAIDMFHYDSEP
tara:strand:- start:7674 stop:8546 length:873 start_codon:yes stop_codon:yes gene_type:complete